MTEAEGDLYILLSLLHGPSTVEGEDRGTHDPLTKTSDAYWWVYRNDETADGLPLCSPNFNTRAEAAKAYCDHYNIAP